MQYKWTIILIFVLSLFNVILGRKSIMGDLKDKEYSGRHLRRLTTDFAQYVEETFDGSDDNSATSPVHEAFDSSTAKVEDVLSSSKNYDPSLPLSSGECDVEDENINLDIFNEDEFEALIEEFEKILDEILDEEWPWQESDEELDEDRENVSDPESGESEIDSNLQNVPIVLSRRNKLAQWAVNCSINHNALDSLLPILKNDFGGTELPSRGKYLVKTPKEKPVTKKIGDGEYLHFGLKKQLIKLIPKVNNSNFEIQINIDGLPIAKSNTKSLWPILGVLRGTRIVFIIGIFSGCSKPTDPNLFLRDFVDEAKDLTENGFRVGKKHYNFCIKELILDAPAKSFVLKIKGHTGYNSCTKCETEGFHDGSRVYFPDVGKLRTDQSFLAQSDWDFHVGTSILTEIPNLNIVTNTVLDYMHLLCLGVMRKLMLLWIAGKNLAMNYRLSYQQVVQISNILETIVSKNTPKEFARKGRSLKYLKQFKATELRQLLLYTGVVVFKTVLKPEAFEHYLNLVVACRILCSEKIEIEGFLDYAKELLQYFVKAFGVLYGEQYISHNVHNLYHIVDDVKKHGNLDDFSAFIFENFLQRIKNLLRKPGKPLEQIFNRFHEESEISELFEEPIVSSNLKLSFDETRRSVKFNGFEIVPNSNADNCVLLENGKVAIVEDAFKKGDDIDIVVKEFAELNDLFTVNNFSSTEVGMYNVSKLSDRVKVFKASAIVKKCFKMARLDDKDAYAVATLLHSDKSGIVQQGRKF